MPSLLRRTLAGLAMAAAIAVPALAADALETMQKDPRFKTWVKIVNAAGLEGYPRGAAPAFTVFAPVDASFANLPDNTLQAVLPHAVDRGIDTSETVYVVRSHVVDGMHRPAEIRSGTMTSINGYPLVIDASKPDHVVIKFQTSTGYISGPPLAASNALIYPVILTEAHYEQH